MDITALVTNGYLHMLGAGVGIGIRPDIIDSEVEQPTIKGSGLSDDAGPFIVGAAAQVPSVSSSKETPVTEPTAPTIIGGKVEAPSIRKK